MSKLFDTELGALVNVKHGFPFKSEFFEESGDLVVLTPGNFFEEGGFKRNAEKDKCYSAEFPEDYLLKKGEILIAMTEQAEGLLGSMATVPKSNRFLHNQRLGLVTSKCSETNIRYIYHLSKTPWIRKQIRLSSSGSKVKHTSPDRISEVKVKILPPDQQIKSASLLDTIDEKIELNNRINAELESLARLLYDYWFVQFDFPMTAEQAAVHGDPSLTGKPYKSSGGKMTHNKNLNLEIPVEWHGGVIEELASLNQRSWNQATRPETVQYVDLANTKNGTIQETQQFAWEEAPSRARRILCPDDSIIGTVRPGNRSFALIGPDTKDLTGSTGFAVISPTSSENREFVYLTLTAPTNIDRLATIASGAAYPAVKPEVIAQTPCPLPPPEILEAFHKATASNFDLIANNQKQNQELAALRDWLLPMLMNGQVTVNSKK